MARPDRYEMWVVTHDGYGLTDSAEAVLIDGPVLTIGTETFTLVDGKWMDSRGEAHQRLLIETWVNDDRFWDEN